MFRVCNHNHVLNRFDTLELAKKYLRDLRANSPLVGGGCWVEKKISDDFGDFVWIRTK